MDLNTLIPWNRKTALERGGSEHPLLTFQREMDRLFDEIWQRWDLTPTSGNAGERFGWVPQTDIAESEEAVEVTMELPGLGEEDIEIVQEGDRLIVRGEKRQERQEGGRETGWLLSERRWGTFQRVMPLPSTIDRDRIEATFDKGVLTLTLPKTEDAKRETRRIEVRKTPIKRAA